MTEIEALKIENAKLKAENDSFHQAIQVLEDYVIRPLKNEIADLTRELNERDELFKELDVKIK